MKFSKKKNHELRDLLVYEGGGDETAADPKRHTSMIETDLKVLSEIQAKDKDPDDFTYL